MEQNKSYKRRQYLINKDFQIRFIFKFCLLLLSASVLSTVILMYLSEGTLTSTFNNSRLVISSTASAILPATLLTNIITICVVAIATILVTLFVSHKIAGPLFRFQKEVREIAKGNLSINICLRKKDQIKDIADELNAMCNSLGQKIKGIREEIFEISEMAKNGSEIQQMSSALNKLLNRIDNEFIL